MTDADTPRVPDLWQHPEHGYIAQVPEGRLGEGRWHKVDVASGRYITNFDEPRPADAVKLGDVEAARRELAAKHYVERARANQAERERDALRADIRAIVADPMLDEAMMLDAINARLDREPDREEPAVTPPDTNGRFVGDEFHPLTDLDGWQPSYPEGAVGD